MTDLYTVFGNPIAHSLSPTIHTHFAQSLGDNICYTRTLAERHHFSGSLNTFAQQGGLGANVTVPFKEEAYTLCAELSDRAKKAKAVNTLIRINHTEENPLWRGDNTDGIGLVIDIQRLGITIAQQRVLILGAGGAVRGVLHPLITENPASITIANRTAEKASALAHEFTLNACTFAEANQQHFDIIINGTSASLHGEIPPISKPLFQASLCYDMVYHTSGNTAFTTHAKAQGCPNTADGLGMLLAQAAASYQLWRNKIPDITPLLQQFRQPEK